LGIGWACTSPLLPDDAPDDPLSNFDVLWTEFDRHYAFFIQKGVDWDATGTEHRARIGLTTTPEALFVVMSEMLAVLRDGHVSLRAPFDTFQYTDWLDSAPTNFDPDVVRGYLGSSATPTPSRRMLYGRIDSDIGYVWVPTLGGRGWVHEIDRVLSALIGADAIVVDIRGNGGGSDTNAEAIAGRFADARRLYRQVQYRDGPGHSEFTDPIEDYIEPAGAESFRGPVAVLTNRAVFSSAESFLLSMRTIPSVVVVGDTTGGGYGNPIGRELPNGWTFRVPRWIELLPDGTPLRDGVGLPPDTTVRISSEDEAAGVDAILETAVELLRTRAN
jgi:hypothetical protein